jgi:hypothetical protein
VCTIRGFVGGGERDADHGGYEGGATLLEEGDGFFRLRSKVIERRNCSIQIEVAPEF